MKYIKYTKKVHSDGLLRCGSIRIGTLKDYKEGGHGEMVADAMEGAKRFSGTYNNISAEKIKSSLPLSSIVNLESGNINLSINNVTFIEPDYYIFSFAQGYSLHTHEKWHLKNGYDVAYVIELPSTFFKKITKELNKHNAVEFLGLFKVYYYDEKKGMDFFDPLNKLPAYCLKDDDGFSDQDEIRAVWRPINDQSIHPVNLNVASIERYIHVESQLHNTQ